VFGNYNKILKSRTLYTVRFRCAIKQFKILSFGKSTISNMVSGADNNLMSYEEKVHYTVRVEYYQLLSSHTLTNNNIVLQVVIVPSWY